MKKILYIIFLVCTSAHFAMAQDSTLIPATITGKVVDSVGHKLGFSGVFFRNSKDTTVFASVAADSLGNFKLNAKLPAGTYSVEVQHVGFGPTRQVFSVFKGQTLFDIPDIMLFGSTGELAAVVVRSVIPMKMNGDTVELNADAYHVKPNATAEDLLKKLPGVEIDASGNIQAQGETVSRVLVNGKRFFGSDPKMATQNLPKDIVDKIQIYDAQSDQSAFSGFDDGNRVKTINIVIKKDKNVGDFGKMTAGVGRNDQTLYNVGGNINRFNNDQKISILGQTNNVNSQMFTLQDLTGGNGRPGGGGGGGGGRGAGASGTFGGASSGITKTIAAGLNYMDKWNNTDFSGSYFYNNTKTFNDGHSERQNLYQDVTQNTNQLDTTHTISWNQNHRLQFNVESKLDSNNAIIVRPSLSFINTDNESNSVTDIFRDNNGQREYITKSSIASTAHNSGYNGSGNALYQHRFGGKAGRTISFGVDWSGNKNDGYGYNTNNVNYIAEDSLSNTQRYYVSKSNGNTLGGTLSYTEPIAKYQELELSYNHTYTKNTSDRTTYNLDEATNEYNMVDENLTNHFENTYNSDRATLGYHYNNNKINFSASSGVQFGRLHSVNLSKDYDPINQKYTNFYPTASFRWNMEQARRLNIDYSGRTTQPSVTQLQPLLDNTNELVQSMGNPDLKQSFTHSIRARYFFFNRGKNTHLFSMLSYSTVQHSIVSATTRLTSGGQLTGYTNLNGNYSINGFFDYGFPIIKPQSNFSMRTSIGLSKSPNLIINPVTGSLAYDTSVNYTRNYSFGERLGWTTNLESTFDVNISTEPQYTISKYSVSSNNNTDYFSQNVNLEGTWYTQSGWQATANFNYTYYTGLYNTSVPLLNVSFSRMVFKNKAGEVKLSVNDLLNQNRALTNTRSDNYIQTSTNTVLKRYVMLSFVYNLKQFGQKGNFRNRDGNFRDGMPMPPGGGMGGGFGGGRRSEGM